MFIQIIQGHVKDADLLLRQTEKWRTEIKPGAIGYLGATGGVTPDGIGITIARFDSEASAQANSERPEQSAWWEATAPAFDGEVTFDNCTDVDLMFGGGADHAGFVQIIQGRAIDPAAMRELGRAMEDDLRATRSDLLGGMVAWHGDREFTQVVYFSSEDDARKGESTMQENPATAQRANMFDGPPRFLDLPHPDID